MKQKGFHLLQSSPGMLSRYTVRDTRIALVPESSSGSSGPTGSLLGVPYSFHQSRAGLTHPPPAPGFLFSYHQPSSASYRTVFLKWHFPAISQPEGLFRTCGERSPGGVAAAGAERSSYCWCEPATVKHNGTVTDMPDLKNGSVTTRSFICLDSRP